MRVLILGSKGSMGKRYAAILKHLNVPCTEFDVKDGNPLNGSIKQCDRVIVATPTSTHMEVLDIITTVMPGAPILCEKPVTKSLSDLEQILSMCDARGNDLRMMYQYSLLASDDLYLQSHYNYYAHGSDGIQWDCMQIIGLAKGKVVLKEDSPIWKCTINGKKLKRSDMDRAYVDYVNNWIIDPSFCCGPSEIMRIHKKVSEWKS